MVTNRTHTGADITAFQDVDDADDAVYVSGSQMVGGGCEIGGTWSVILL